MLLKEKDKNIIFANSSRNLERVNGPIVRPQVSVHTCAFCVAFCCVVFARFKTIRYKIKTLKFIAKYVNENDTSLCFSISSSLDSSYAK